MRRFLPMAQQFRLFCYNLGAHTHIVAQIKQIFRHTHDSWPKNHADRGRHRQLCCRPEADRGGGRRPHMSSIGTTKGINNFHQLNYQLIIQLQNHFQNFQEFPMVRLPQSCDFRAIRVGGHSIDIKTSFAEFTGDAGCFGRDPVDPHTNLRIFARMRALRAPRDRPGKRTFGPPRAR